ncbi:MAG: ABC transporter permease subunit [Gammaproteobacteria bacterium]|nr:ABC transporter permease subunit [Gammaproteobacteria bacterium]
MTELSFKPTTVDSDIEQTSRPSLSYWQDAFVRLVANKRAIASLVVIVLLLIFAFIAPHVFWTIKHDVQNLDRTSEPPWINRKAMVLPDQDDWQDVHVAAANGEHQAPTALEVVGEPTTSRVRLKWDPVPNAFGYRIYRNIIEPTEDIPLGLSMGVNETGTHVSFEDRLAIRQKPYWYSVVALNEDGTEFEAAKTIYVRPQLAITVSEALELTKAENVQPGDTVSLFWHPLGTDYLGRDMLARLMKGAQVSLTIGIVAPLLFIVLGIIIGSVSGYFGGVVDAGLMRFTDFVIALPFLLFMILFKLLFVPSGDTENWMSKFQEFLGIEGGMLAMVVALVLLSWPGIARLVRGEVLKIREQGYVDASRLLGAPNSWLIGRHMIPNTMGVVLVSFTFAVPATIFTEAFLSFIGMGVVPPTPSWGSMCNDGIRTMEMYPHELLFPALFISITVLAFNLLGDGLRDALDARMRSRE